MMTPEAKNQAKQAVGIAAANMIEDGMLVGIGTGSTVKYFIDELIKRCQNGLKITAVASSDRSAQRAGEGAIPLKEAKDLITLDIVVDSADEIDHQKRMIKGGGGALLREKIIATMSQDVIIIIDEDKLVTQLGRFPLPIEISSFAPQFILDTISKLGYQGKLRQNKSGDLYLTDNGNLIIDVTWPHLCQNPERDHAILQNIPGVFETGFFFDLAKTVLVGKASGKIQILS